MPCQTVSLALGLKNEVAAISCTTLSSCFHLSLQSSWATISHGAKCSVLTFQPSTQPTSALSGLPNWVVSLFVGLVLLLAFPAYFKFQSEYIGNIKLRLPSAFHSDHVLFLLFPTAHISERKFSPSNSNDMTKNEPKGRRDGSGVKNTCGSSGGPRFSSVVPIPGVHTLSSEGTQYMHTVHRHTQAEQPYT